MEDSNNSEDLIQNLFSNSSFIEGKKQNIFDLVYPFGYQTISYDISNEKKMYYKRINYIYYILKKSTIILKINTREEIKIKFEKFIYEEGEEGEKREIAYEQFITRSKEEQEQKYDLNEIYILFESNYKKLIGFLDKIERQADEFCSQENLQNELYLIKINLEEENNKIINSKYIIENSFSNNMTQYQDKNILNDGNYEGFTLFLREIKNLEQESINNNSIQGQIFLQEEINLVQININNNSTEFESNNKKIYNFISFKEKKGKHKEITDNVIELKDGSLLTDGKIIKFKIDFNQIEKFDFKNNFHPCTEKNRVIISLENKINNISPDQINKNNTNNSNIETMYPCRNLFKLKNGKYIICYENRIYYSSNIFSLVLNRKSYLLSKNAYIGGIKINDDIIAFMSFHFLSKKENKLVFFNSKLERFLNDILLENYSFSLLENNYPIMRIPKYENSKFLLVACKKYIKGDKNGILLIKLQLFEDDLKKTYQKFYDTKNFEVYCFCPILEMGNIFDTQKNESEYFLVGGFDLNRNEGLIKLYKIIYYDKNENIEIEFIQDIIIEKKIGFRGPITCINVSQKNQILVTCYDGNEYLSSEPNLDMLRKIEDFKNLI